MRWKIRRCRTCGEYTLKEVCPRCGGETFTPHPIRFSPEYKYIRYRKRVLENSQPRPSTQ
ncbi:MAG: RNA-protein complex protein Nop10 [Candidatus Bathyarchaeia archaeon]